MADAGRASAEGRPAPPPLKPVHILAILIAALCHDVDHPGLSNKFLLSTR
jgi:hypothetical protein